MTKGGSTHLLLCVYEYIPHQMKLISNRANRWQLCTALVGECMLESWAGLANVGVPHLLPAGKTSGSSTIGQVSSQG
jgi:hypothetical protein